MIEEIVMKIKTGSIANVIRYGESRPETPYVVVKEEGQSPVDPGVIVRIIAHMEPGQHKFLTSYVLVDLYDLLHDQPLQDVEGNRTSLLSTGEVSGIIKDNDDGSIAKERCFLLPGAPK